MAQKATVTMRRSGAALDKQRSSKVS